MAGAGEFLDGVAGAAAGLPHVAKSGPTPEAPEASGKPGPVAKQRRPPSRPTVRGAALKEAVATRRAQGVSKPRVAAEVGLARQTVYRMEHLPEVAQRITELRAEWKHVSHRAVTGMAEDTWA